MYLVLWKGYPPESASWQYPVERKGDGGIPHEMVDEYEAALEAEAELEAEEADSASQPAAGDVGELALDALSSGAAGGGGIFAPGANSAPKISSQ